MSSIIYEIVFIKMRFEEMKFDFNTYTKDYIDADVIKTYAAKTTSVKKKFEINCDELKWYHMNEYVDNMELKEMIELGKQLKETTDVLLVIGIGGSYAGAHAIYDALKPYFHRTHPEILFLGTNLSSRYLQDLFVYLKDKRVSMNVISKSGNTMETMITYQILMTMMQKRYSKKELKKRIFITTNIHQGKLLESAKKYGYRTFFVPDHISGRYSVLTPVALFPMAVAGFDIISFLTGAKEGRMHLNYASIYAMVRTIFFKRERMVEAFTIYEPKLAMFTEWLKQLFAESEGKDCKGILPIGVMNPRDLHSLGQFISEGNPILFETVLKIEDGPDLFLPKYQEHLREINHLVLDKVCEAHKLSGCPSNVITIESLDEYHLGEACMFFMMAAALSAYLIDVDPFTQPGVETYKELLAKELRVL